MNISITCIYIYICAHVQKLQLAMYTQTLKDVHSPKLHLRDTFTKPTRFWTFDENYSSIASNATKSVSFQRCAGCVIFFWLHRGSKVKFLLKTANIAMGQNDWTPKVGLPIPILWVPLIPLI